MSKKTKQATINNYKFSISLECDDIERTSGVIEVETIESERIVIQKIKDAFEMFNIGEGEKYGITGFGFDEFLEFLKRIYGIWIVHEVIFDRSFVFYG